MHSHMSVKIQGFRLIASIYRWGRICGEYFWVKQILLPHPDLCLLFPFLSAPFTSCRESRILVLLQKSTNICSCWKPLPMIKSLLCGFRHCLQWTKVHCPPCPACKCLDFCCGYLFCGSVNSESAEFFRLFPCLCWSLWCFRCWLLTPFPPVPVDSVEYLSVEVALCF